MVFTLCEQGDALMGLVFDVKHFAVHDGPGVRTTVFLKGCPLRCLWCHSPESQSPDVEIGFYPGLCIGCGACVEVCPRGAQTTVPLKIRRELCSGCGMCAEACYAGALVKFAGYWSLVVPHFCGEGLRPLTRCGVHLFYQGRFARLTRRLTRGSAISLASVKALRRAWHLSQLSR